MAVVLTTSGTIGYLTDSSPNWVDSQLSVMAVMVTFLHAQVSDRLREYAEGNRTIPPECSRLERVYYLWKEGLWLMLFLHQWNLPALMGTVAFILYPRWRAYHRRPLRP